MKCNFGLMSRNRVFFTFFVHLVMVKPQICGFMAWICWTLPFHGTPLNSILFSLDCNYNKQYVLEWHLSLKLNFSLLYRYWKRDHLQITPYFWFPDYFRPSSVPAININGRISLKTLRTINFPFKSLQNAFSSSGT